MFDCHIHTKFSTDSKMNIDNAKDRADNLNIGIIITEHMDIDYPDEGKFIFSPDEYFKEYSKYRSDKLLLGIEIGMQQHCINQNRKLAFDYPFDYIIGSIHLVDGIDIFQQSFYEGRQKKDVFLQYLNNMLLCVKNSEFINSLGHIDYISRYARYYDAEMYYQDYCDIIDEILKTIIDKGIALEFNTKRLPNKAGCNNIKDIFKRYYELGGRFATIGSDAHYPEYIGKEFSCALETLEDCNIKPVYFKEREIQYMK